MHSSISGVLWSTISLLGIFLRGPAILFSSVSLLHITFAQSQLLSRHQRGRALNGLPLEPSPRIINGFEVEPFRYPYMALLTDQGSLKCGGSVRATERRGQVDFCSSHIPNVMRSRLEIQEHASNQNDSQMTFVPDVLASS
jgi:hypothetical protein